MKKVLIGISLLLILAVIGYVGYGYFATASYGTVNVNLGSIDEKSVTVCKDKSVNSRIVCLSDELKKTASSEVLAALQLNYSVDDAKKWSNFPPVGYRNRVGKTLDEFSKLILRKRQKE